MADLNGISSRVVLGGAERSEVRPALQDVEEGVQCEVESHEDIRNTEEHATGFGL